MHISIHANIERDRIEVEAKWNKFDLFIHAAMIQAPKNDYVIKHHKHSKKNEMKYLMYQYKSMKLDEWHKICNTRNHHVWQEGWFLVFPKKQR